MASSSGNRIFDGSPDCAVIAKFGFLTDSPNCCSFPDVTCRNGRVIEIDTFAWQLSSSASSFSSSTSSTSSSNPKKEYRIPEDIGSMTELERLKVTFPRDVSYVYGMTVPASIAKLSKLYELSLDHGRLSGAIPAEIGSLPNLGILRLSNQNLEGPIPPSIGDLKNLTVLDLSKNQLTGSLPAGLGNRNLTTLSVSNNKLVGVVPKLSSTIKRCDLNGLFDDNEFWCYGDAGAAPAICLNNNARFADKCPAGLDGSGPSHLTRPGFIATIAIAVLVPLLAVFCVRKAKRVPTTEPKPVEKPTDVVAEGNDSAAAATGTDAAGDNTKAKDDKPKRKCCCFDLVPGVKLLLGLQAIAGIAMAILSTMLANMVGAISPRQLARTKMSVTDRDYLAFMVRVSAVLSAWSTLLALFMLASAVSKNLQAFRLFTAIYWGYIIAAPVSLVFTAISASGTGTVAFSPASLVGLVVQFYWAVCFARYIEYLEEEKAKAISVDGVDESGESTAARNTVEAS